MIDSFLAVIDTTAQSLASDLQVPKLIATTEVSAQAVIAQDLVAVTAKISALHVDGRIGFSETNSGELFVVADQAVSASATYVEAVTTSSSISTFLVNFTNSAGSLVYGASATRSFHGQAAISLRASGAATNTLITLAVDGSSLARTEQAAEVGTSLVEMEVHGMVRLATNERVSVMLKGDAAVGAGWVIERTVLTVKQ